MKAVELKKESLQGNVFAIEGDDSYWVSYAEHFFVDLIPEDTRCFDVRYIETLSSYNSILEAIDTPSMMCAEVVVIVRDPKFKGGADSKPSIADIISQVPQDTYLIFSGVQFLTPKLKKMLTVIDASRLDTYDARKTIKGLFGSQEIDNRAMDALIEYTNRDMARIETEVNKLKAYAHGALITLNDIDNLVANTIDNEIYEFCNAIAAKNIVLAYKILDRFVAKGVSYTYILSTIIGQYRRMLHASLTAPISVNDVATSLGSKPFAIQKARESSKKYTKTALKEIVDILVQAEFAFKSGAMSEETAIRTAITNIILK
ncbi:MAG: DNA polymerase III subunit delta [Bacillota bacterium]